ncbi:DUF6480 family protein [Streptomyces sp. NPDC037389]|uniref:DUF6480 family protein n=1 Tax=Streptomyces sp. NPDC037389 TaxID=3155369 RepID=UPI0033EA170A
MTHDPEPERTPGLEPGGGVPPGETPPGEDSTGGIGPRDDMTRGWAKGPVFVIGALVVIFAITVLIWAAIV